MHHPRRLPLWLCASIIGLAALGCSSTKSGDTPQIEERSLSLTYDPKQPQKEWHGNTWSNDVLNRKVSFHFGKKFDRACGKNGNAYHVVYQYHDDEDPHADEIDCAERGVGHTLLLRTKENQNDFP